MSTIRKRKQGKLILVCQHNQRDRLHRRYQEYHRLNQRQERVQEGEEL